LNIFRHDRIGKTILGIGAVAGWTYHLIKLDIIGNKKSFSQSTLRAQRNAEGFPDADFF